MRPIYLTILALSLAVAVPPAGARSFQLGRGDLVEAYQHASTVYWGELLHADQGDWEGRGRFRVLRRWKGAIGAETALRSYTKAGLWEGEVGARYLVFANAGGQWVSQLPRAATPRDFELLDRLAAAEYPALAGGSGAAGPASLSTTPRPTPRSSEDTEQKRERFRRAHELQAAGKSRIAAELLEASIAAWPGAADLDYEYAWAALCRARLEELEPALAHYQALTENYYGFVPFGTGQNWSRQLRAIRDAVAASDRADAQHVLHRMEELHIEAIREFRLAVLETVSAAAAGEPEAQHRLAGPRYAPELQALVAAGLLDLSHRATAARNEGTRHPPFDCARGPQGGIRAEAVSPDLVPPCRTGSVGTCPWGFNYRRGTGWCEPR